MTRLDLSNSAIVAPGTGAEIRSANAIVDEVKAAMAAMGLQEQPQPESYPTPLADLKKTGGIENLPNPQLGALYAEYVAYAAYIGGKLAEVTTAYKIAVSNLKKVDAKLRAEFFAKGKSKAEGEVRVKEDPLYDEFNTEMLKLYAMKTILDAYHHSFETQAAALSRVVTLRELEFKQGYRENTVGKKKAGERPYDLRRG